MSAGPGRPAWASEDPGKFCAELVDAAAVADAASRMRGSPHVALYTAIAAWLRHTVGAHEMSLSGACLRCREPDALFGGHTFPSVWPCEDLLSAKWVADALLGKASS